MKPIALLLFLLCCSPLAQAQTDHCDKFSALLDKAKTLWAQKKFEDAFAKLSAAREACPSKAAEVDEQYTIFIRDIANKYETADVKTREAKREAERAKNATDLAEKNAARSDSIATEAARAARRAYANDLAYKSTIALERGDRVAAFRLAEFAHRYVDEDNSNITNALAQVIYYNENAAHPPLPWASNLESHNASVNSVAISPDGKILATGSDDNSAKIWDLQSGNVILTLKGHNASVNSIAFSPDGKRLATASIDNTAKTWDIGKGKTLSTFIGHKSYVSSIAFSPDGKYLATGSGDKTAKIWDAETGKEIRTLNGHIATVSGIAFSPDGKKLVTGSVDKTAKIWDFESGKEIRTLNGHDSYISSIAFSPDGKKIATGSDDKTAKTWDAETGMEIRTFSGHNSYVSSIAFSPDGKKIATGSIDKTAKIWDTETGKDVIQLVGHNGFVNSVAFSPDGKKIATGSMDNLVKIWELETDKDILVLSGHSSYISGVAFSPEGKKIATCSGDSNSKIWDLNTGRDELTLTGHDAAVNGIAFSPDGKKIATSSDDKTVKIWDIENGNAILTLSGHNSYVNSAVFSPDGQKLATGSDDYNAKVWELQTGKTLITFKGHTSHISNVAISPDGKKLATASDDKTAKIWNLETGNAIFTLKGHNASVSSVAFSPDGRILATASMDNTAKIWDVETGKDILTLPGHYSALRSIAFSPDGKYLATGSADKTAKIWNLETGREALTLSGHNAPVNTVIFSPDGKKLATGSIDRFVKIWECTPEGLIHITDRFPLLADLVSSQLSAYNLSGILDVRPKNEAILIQSNDTRQIAAFAELYAENTRNSRNLRFTAPVFARAARLYRYALNSSGDSALIGNLGGMYLRWAEDILTSNRPDTATRYITLACRLCIDKSQCPKLWSEYTEKTGETFDFSKFIDSENVNELRSYGDYFFEKRKWKEAKQLYLKAENKIHSIEVLKNLFTISEHTGEQIDFNLFEATEVADDLNNYASFFFQKAQALETIRNRIPNYNNAILLWEKQMKIDTSIALRTTVSAAYNMLGYSQLFIPDGKMAEQSLLKALELDPANKFPRNKLATAQMLQGRYKEAEAEYKKWAPIPFNEADRPTYREAFLMVLSKMEEQNVQGIDFAQVRAWLEEKN